MGAGPVDLAVGVGWLTGAGLLTLMLVGAE